VLTDSKSAGVERFTRPIKARLILCLWVFLALAASACDQYPADRALGVSLTSDGSAVTVKYVLCPGELVKSVRLFTTDDAGIGDEGDRLLWGVSAARGSSTQDFVLGIAPPGFTELTPLRMQPSKTQALGILVNSTTATAGVLFSGQDLRGDRVLSAGSLSTPGEFKAQAQKLCD